MSEDYNKAVRFVTETISKLLRENVPSKIDGFFISYDVPCIVTMGLEPCGVKITIRAFADKQSYINNKPLGVCYTAQLAPSYLFEKEDYQKAFTRSCEDKIEEMLIKLIKEIKRCEKHD